MDFSAIKTLIEQNIRNNNNEDITGSVLQNVLLGIIETLGDDAINDMITALDQEVTNRQNAVQGEAEARSQADNTILGKIANILNGGYLYQGIAGVSTNPGNPTVSCFYFAKGAGTYTNFRNGDNDPIVITDNGLYALTYEAVENEYWEYNKITDLDYGVFDISRYHASGSTLATYADLSAALGVNGANVPAAFRKGGMSVKFVHSSDNNYVQFRLMKNQWSINTDDWSFCGDDVLVENPEFMTAWTDAVGHLLFWIRKEDGGIDWAVGVPEPVKAYVNDRIADILNGNEGTDIDGLNKVFAFLNDFSTSDTLADLLGGKVDVVPGKGLSTNDYTDDDKAIVDMNELVENPEFMDVELDAETKILSGRRKEDGVKFETVGFETPSLKTDSLDLSKEGLDEFQQALKENGFKPGGAGDWSDYLSNNGKTPLTIPVPRLAYINLTNANGDLTWPTSKTSDFEAIMEFSDMQGNYFKKNVIFNAQGNSSMAFIKKNGSVKMFDASVYNSKGKKGKGDKFGVKFGDWVPQTTYHLKAFYTDYFKGVSWIAYQIALQVANTRGIFEDRTWKKGLFNDMQFTDKQFENPQIDDQNLQIDNGALCQPDGFPCIVHLNGEFYGIYVCLIKKDAANFNMKNDCAEHIHLDGKIDNGTLFNANGDASQIKWNPARDGNIEVRNPEDLIAMVYNSDTDDYDIVEYDSDVDADQELAGVRNLNDTIPSYSASQTYAKADMVTVDGREYMSLVNDNIGNNPADAMCEEHGDEFDDATDYWIDITFNNKVKKYILQLSTYKSSISDAVDLTSKKALFEEYFDLQNLVDYINVQSAVGDGDSFQKNCQWTTWDGNKWFANNYDKDCSFGNSFVGMFTNDAPVTVESFRYSPYNFVFADTVYWYEDELKQRWRELVSQGIFTKENFTGIFKKWCQRIGSVNYAKEYTKWPEAPCNRDSGINTEYWEYVSANYNETPQSTYDSTAQYNVGDTCIIGSNSYNITFRCVKPCVGENPLSVTYTNNPTILGYRDNLWRVCKFIEKSLNAYNNYANIN